MAHRELTRLARSRAGLDFEEGRLLLAALRGGAHAGLGYGSFVEYVERLFGYGGRLTQDKLRVAEALETLPAMSEALRAGQVCWSVLRELTRVATHETEGEWLDAARGRTVREVEKLVAGHGLGSRPGDPRDAMSSRHVLRFDVSGEVLAIFREALAKLRREAGESLTDDAVLLMMARYVLEGPRDEGRASYQVALTVCESCRRGTLQGRGEPVDVGREIVEMAACDSQHIGSVADAHVGHDEAAPAPNRRAVRARQDIPPAVRRLVLRRDGGRCVFPGCRHATFLDIPPHRNKSRGWKPSPGKSRHALRSASPGAASGPRLRDRERRNEARVLPRRRHAVRATRGSSEHGT